MHLTFSYFLIIIASKLTSFKQFLSQKINKKAKIWQ